MKLLVLLASCACLPLAASLAPGFGAAAHPAVLRPVRPVTRVQARPTQLVRAPAPAATLVRPVQQRPAKASVPEPAPAPGQAPPRPTSEASHLPGASHSFVQLRETLSARLVEELEPGQSCPDSLVASVRRSGLDPDKLSDGELQDLYRDHRELNQKMEEQLEKIELLLLDSLTPGGPVVWEQFEVEGDALTARHRR